MAIDEVRPIRDDIRARIEKLLDLQADGGWNCEAETGSTRGSCDTQLVAGATSVSV